MKRSKKPRVAVLGGSFNPIQVGHLLQAAELHHAGFDEVWIVPCGPREDKEELAPALDRFVMAQEAVDAWFGSRFPIKVLATEIFLCRALSTYRLMKMLGAEYPKHDLHFVLGADLYEDVPYWKNARRVMRECKFVVVERPGYKLPAILRRNFELLKPQSGQSLAHMFISANEVRCRLRKDVSTAEGLVPNVVLAHIIRYGLYRTQKKQGGK